MHIFCPEHDILLDSAPDSYEIVVGNIRLDGNDGTVFQILMYYYPSSFDPVTKANDIALIKVGGIFYLDAKY